MLLLVARADADERLEIVLSQRLGPASQRGSGFLGSVSQTQPPDDVVRALRPRLFRLDAFWSKQLYGRVTRLGASAQMVPSFPFFAGPSSFTDYETWFAAWEKSLAATLDETIAHDEDWQWDIWNEPNWPRFWIGSRDQFFETWRRSHALIRARQPNAVIVGPSIAYYDAAYLEAFLLYAKTHAVLPDVLSWHELTPQSPGLIPSRVAAMRAFLSSNAIPISRIQINEILPPTHQFRPGSIVWFLAALERAGVEAACKACWEDGGRDNCSNESLNGLLTAPALEPRSAYWACKAYADISGQLVQVVPSHAFDGIAGADSRTVRAVIANHDSATQTLAVTITGLASQAAFADQGVLRVRAHHIPNTEREPLAEPLLLFDEQVPVAADAVRLGALVLDAWSAVTLEVTAGSGPQAPRNLRTLTVAVP